MGLLTSTDQRENNRIFKFLSKWCNVSCVLATALGVLAHLIVMWPTFNLGTYISENALLPGLVTDEFDDDFSVHSFRDSLRMAVAEEKMPWRTILAHLSAMGLDAEAQHFTTTGYFDEIPRNGTNVYGIVRAPRGSSSESIALVVPFSEDNIPGLAVALAVVSFLNGKPYWAKDIILVVTDKGAVGTQAWLTAYHGIRSDHIFTGPLRFHAGILQAAIAVEWSEFEVTDHIFSGPLRFHAGILQAAIAVEWSEFEVTDHIFSGPLRFHAGILQAAIAVEWSEFEVTDHIFSGPLRFHAGILQAAIAVEWSEFEVTDHIFTGPLRFHAGILQAAIAVEWSEFEVTDHIFSGPLRFHAGILQAAIAVEWSEFEVTDHIFSGPLRFHAGILQAAIAVEWSEFEVTDHIFSGPLRFHAGILQAAIAVEWSEFEVTDHIFTGPLRFHAGILQAAIAVEWSEFEVTDHIFSGPLRFHAGILQAAIAVEWSECEASHVDILYHGVNGQLPNLDLINAACRIMEKHGLQPTLLGEEGPDAIPFGEMFNTKIYREYLEMGYRSLWKQAVGRPTGSHGVFGQFGIEAITVRPWYPPRIRRHRESVGVLEVGKFLEGMLRSINNILERFHQSFFFYILLSTRRFVSIAYYMPAVGLILLVPVGMACKIWSAVGADLTCSPPKHGVQLHDVIPAIPIFLVSHLFGFLVFSLPTLLRWYPMSSRSDSELVIRGLVAITLAQISLPLLSRRRLSFETRHVVKTAALLELALVIGCTSILNFGLGLLLAVFYGPLLTLTCASEQRFLKFLHRAILLILHPIVLPVLCLVIYEAYVLRSPLDQHLLLDVSKRVSAFAIETYESRQLYNCWLFSHLALALMPLWSVFWGVV